MQLMEFGSCTYPPEKSFFFEIAVDLCLQFERPLAKSSSVGKEYVDRKLQGIIVTW